MSIIGNTRKLVQKLQSDSLELTAANSADLRIEKPYLLIAPTYGKGSTEPLRAMLDNEQNLAHCRGIIGAGNRNFARGFCHTAKSLSRSYDLPLLHLMELQGSSHDVEIINKEIEKIGTTNA